MEDKTNIYLNRYSKILIIISIIAIVFVYKVEGVHAETLTKNLNSFAYLRKAVDNEEITRRTPTSANTYNTLNFNNNVNAYLFSSLSLGSSSFTENNVNYPARISNIFLSSYVLTSQCSSNCDLPIAFNLQWNADVSNSTTNEQKLLTEIQWFLNNYNKVYIVFTDNSDKEWRVKLNTQVLQSNQYEENSRLKYYLNIYYTLTLYDVKYINYIDIEFPRSAYQEQKDASTNSNVDWTNTYLTFNTFAYAYQSYSGGSNGTDGTDNSQDVINQLQQETNEKLDDIYASIQDSNIENGLGSSFFNNFSTTDNKGISGILTAPLNAINQMLSGTCQPMEATITMSNKTKTISLPCGTEFWNKEGFATIRPFLIVLESGILAYAIIRKLFILVHDLKEPDNDKVEVMKL